MNERDEIRNRIDIVSLISSDMPLRKVGKNYQGLCPFHPDKRPSMTVSPDTGRYKCWSCGAAGDIFNWVMARQNVEFGEAIQILAKEAGVTLKRGAATDKRKPFPELMQSAVGFYRDQLSKDQAALEFCRRRQITPEQIEQWDLGYAPSIGEALAVHLKREGFTLQDAKEIFLLDNDAGGGFFDKFRGRLIFPIRDERGNLVALGGRVLGNDLPKYINSGDTPLYRKSRVLYGFYCAKDAIGKSRRAVLVEGYMDVIACHAAGVTEAIASLGTSATEDQAKLVKRWADEVVILYDQDEAGQKAADRAISVFSAEGLRVKVALMPPGEDPDSLLKSKGAGAVQAAVEVAVPPIDFKLTRLQARLKPSSEAFWQEALEILAQSPNELELDRQLVKLAPLYPGLADPIDAQKALRKTVQQLRKAQRVGDGRMATPTKTVLIAPSVKNLNAAEVVILRAFLSETYRRHAYMIARQSKIFVTQGGKEISLSIASAFPTEPPSGAARHWLDRIENEQHRELLAGINEDLRGHSLSDDYIADSVESLMEKNAWIQARTSKDAMSSDDDRQSYLERLKKLKPTFDSEDDSLLKDW